MMKSMTGFGRCEVSEGQRKFTVELKGVNHRYLDVNIRMPKKLNFFESAIRSLLKESVHRGKVDIFITYEDFSESQVSLKYNETLAAEYLEKFKMMEEKFSLENDIRVSTLSRYPEVLTMEEKMDDEEELWKGLKKALDGAIAQFVQTRTVEGENLKKDLIAKLDGMLELVGQIEKGDIIVAGKNFGCGSSREQAPEIIKALGISCVIAKSFARIFFRNSINNGLLLIEQPDLHDDIKEGDTITVKMNEHVDYNGKTYPIAALPENLMDIIQAGGLVKAMRKRNGLD
mgnify:CR=1 FL=1